MILKIFHLRNMFPAMVNIYLELNIRKWPDNVTVAALCFFGRHKLVCWFCGSYNLSNLLSKMEHPNERKK